MMNVDVCWTLSDSHSYTNPQDFQQFSLTNAGRFEKFVKSANHKKHHTERAAAPQGQRASSLDDASRTTCRFLERCKKAKHQTSHRSHKSGCWNKLFKILVAVQNQTRKWNCSVESSLASGCWLHEPRADCITRWDLELEGSKQSDNPPLFVAMCQNKESKRGEFQIQDKSISLAKIFLGQVRRFCCSQRCGKFGKEPRRPRLSSARVSCPKKGRPGKRSSKTAHVTVPLAERREIKACTQRIINLTRWGQQ